jgi:acid phosphatase type 7
MGSRSLLAALGAALLAVVLLGGSASARPAETTPTVADAYVSAGAPRSSFGRAKRLLVAPTPRTVTLLQFRLEALGDEITGAQLRLYAERSRLGGKVTARLVADGWSERVSYRSAPKPGTLLGSARVKPQGGWATVRLGPVPRQSGLLSVALTSSRPVAFRSRETAFKPALVLDRRASPVIAAAGNIACDPRAPEFNGGAGTNSECGMRRTSELLAAGGLAAVLALGDNQYPCGAYADFLAAFDPAWGRVKSLIHPVMGNHDFACDFSNAGPGYFQYFGAAAGEAGKGYYSFDIGRWHLIALNSECQAVGGCGTTSPQGQWLQADLAAHRTACTLAFWHYPRFASGLEGNQANVGPFWDLLYAAGADVVLNAHEHHYERFAPQTPAGQVDKARGIREFIVGTGGRMLHGFSFNGANSELRLNQSWGVLKLTLRPTSYSWQFVPVTAGAPGDSGSTACH